MNNLQNILLVQGNQRNFSRCHHSGQVYIWEIASLDRRIYRGVPCMLGQPIQSKLQFVSMHDEGPNSEQNQKFDYIVYSATPHFGWSPSRPNFLMLLGKAGRFRNRFSIENSFAQIWKKTMKINKLRKRWYFCVSNEDISALQWGGKTLESALILWVFIDLSSYWLGE